MLGVLHGPLGGAGHFIYWGVSMSFNVVRQVLSVAGRSGLLSAAVLAGALSMPAVMPAAGASVDAPVVVPQAPGAPASGVPAAPELSGILYSLADPGVAAAAKGGLVQGGIGGPQAMMLDRQLNKASQEGFLPLNFAVADVQPAGPGAASAAVTITGPKMSPYNSRLDFVQEDNWKITRASALQLVAAASGKL
ncbi:low molecular weight antigen Mtb12 [Mycobacteroides abscessus subsp. abscessus]|jgi:hypothetical protein|nr:low molecular weight antigen Mtb12 [Mycobacteroides abscessus subsp. abscessus]